MYKEELDEIYSHNEVEVQRLKDQITILSQDLSRLQSHTSSSDDSHVKVLEEALQKAIEEKTKLKSDLERPKVNRTTSTMPLVYQGASPEPEEPLSPDPEANEGGQTVRVFARVRRILDEERKKDQCIVCVGYILRRNAVEVKAKDFSRKREVHTVTKQFPFERVFDQNSTTADVFSACEDVIDSLFAGGRSCILAYGQTGSGKTYTMQGLLERSVAAVSRRLSGDGLSVECVEVYNEAARNLLTQETEGRVSKIKEFLGRTQVAVQDCRAENVLKLIQTASAGRVTKATEANERSSRSHLIVTLTVKRNGLEGKLMFVDLAGSERLSFARTKGDG